MQYEMLKAISYLYHHSRLYAFCMVFNVRFFSPRVSESISHGKPYIMHVIAYFTLQGTFVMLNALCKVEDDENHVRWIY